MPATRGPHTENGSPCSTPPNTPQMINASRATPSKHITKQLGQLVQQFTDKFQHLALRAGMEEDSDEAMDRYVDGLLPNIQTELLRLRVTSSASSITELSLLACSAEQLVNDIKARQPTPTPKTFFNCTPFRAQPIRAIDANATCAPLSDDTRRFLVNKNGCTTCRNDHHSTSACTGHMGQITETFRDFLTQGNGCTNCRTTGHPRRGCNHAGFYTWRQLNRSPAPVRTVTTEESLIRLDVPAVSFPPPVHSPNPSPTASDQNLSAVGCWNGVLGEGVRKLNKADASIRDGEENYDLDVEPPLTQTFVPNTFSMHFPCTLNRFPATIHVDCGSTGNIMSTAWALQHGIKLQPCNSVSLRVANKQIVRSASQASVQLLCGKYMRTITFHVADIADNVILGLPWFSTIHVTDFKWSEFRFGFKSSSGTNHTWFSTSAPQQLFAPLIGQAAIASIVQRGAELFTISVMPDSPSLTETLTGLLEDPPQAHPDFDTLLYCASVCIANQENKEKKDTPSQGIDEKFLSTCNPRVAALLREFSSVFATPTTLPPSRPEDHTIPLVAGSKPPPTSGYCPPCRS